ncbi:MAG: Crp/Fnr family transcriptional regulator [Rikenellaceae bacterium]
MSSYQNIIDSIREVYPVSDETIAMLISNFREHKIAPKDQIITKGKFDNKVYFIEKGLTRSFCICKDKEVTSWFSKQGDITFGLLDLYHNKPGFEYVEALEHTLAYSVPIEVINTLCETRIDFTMYWLKIHQECLLAVQQHRIDRLSMSAKERYNKWVTTYGELHNRINLGYIASFLGMELPTLSKIRAND